MIIEHRYCPSCGHYLNMETNSNTFFCPGCGSRLLINEYDEVIPIDNLRKNDRSDDIELLKQIQEIRERRWKHIKEIAPDVLPWILIGMVLLFSMIKLMTSRDDREKRIQEYIDAGMITVGISSDDAKGMKYTALVNQLEASGFTNIKTVDLDDAGWFKNKADTVESITIDGDTYFGSASYYDPSARIIISYH